MAACFFAVAVTKIMCDNSENQEKPNDMKEARYLIMVLMVLLCGENFAASPYKVEERSGRKPSWVGKTEKGYIIFSSTGSSLEEARDKCMESIKQEIVQAVAVNVSSEILSTSRQLSENGKYDLYEEYRSDIKSVAARLPFVNDITIANAEASYWERRLNKQTGERIYEFCVKYPFPKAKREMMIAEFKEYDKQQYDKFLKLKEACTSINTVEEIGRYLSEVEPFVAYFFDETRFKEAVALRDMLRGMYNGIAVVEVSNTPGEYIYKLVYDNRDFTLSRLPRVKVIMLMKPLFSRLVMACMLCAMVMKGVYRRRRIVWSYSLISGVRRASMFFISRPRLPMQRLFRKEQCALPYSLLLPIRFYVIH